MLKKLACIAISIALCIISASCTPKANTIGPKSLTQDQRGIVDLLSDNKQEILLFSYAADAQFKVIDVWVETYQQGVLMEPRAGGIKEQFVENKSHQGDLAIVISQTPDFQWKFVLADKGKASSTSNSSENYLSLGRGYVPITSPVTIEDGKEIALYASVFTDGSIRGFDPQDFVRQPDLMKQYPYVHVIKCRFSKESDPPA